MFKVNLGNSSLIIRGFLVLAVISISLMVFLPMTVGAQDPSSYEEAVSQNVNAGTATGLINTVIEVLERIVVLIMVLALVYFLWGALKLITSEGEKREEAKKIILYGIIGLFVMVSVWGLVNIIDKTLRLDDTKQALPDFPS